VKSSQSENGVLGEASSLVLGGLYSAVIFRDDSSDMPFCDDPL